MASQPSSRGVRPAGPARPEQALPRAASDPPRITVHTTLAEIGEEFFSLERGLLHTFLSLSRAPGETMRRWVVHRDARLTRPVRYFVVMVALALLLEWSASLLPPVALPDTPPTANTAPLPQDSPRTPTDSYATGFAKGLSEGLGEGAHNDAQRRVAETLQRVSVEHPEWILLLILPHLALGLHRAFRGFDIGFAEHWAAATYAFAHTYFAQSVLVVVLDRTLGGAGWAPVVISPLLLFAMLARFPKPSTLGHYGRVFAAILISQFLLFLNMTLVLFVYFWLSS